MGGMETGKNNLEASLLEEDCEAFWIFEENNEGFLLEDSWTAFLVVEGNELMVLAKPKLDPKMSPV